MPYDVRLTDHINTRAPKTRGTNPIIIAPKKLWEGIPGHLSPIKCSDDLISIGWPSSRLEHAGDLRINNPTRFSEDGLPSYRFFVDHTFASLLILFKHGNNGFYMLEGPSTLNYPRVEGERQTILGRILSVTPSPSGDGYGIEFDAKNRGKSLWETVGHDNDPDVEFLSPFAPPPETLKSTSFWESRVRSPGEVRMTDLGETPKVNKIREFFERFTPEGGFRDAAIYDPSVGTGYPLIALYSSGFFKSVRLYGNDISREISQMARDRIRAAIDSNISGAPAAKVDIRHGDALGEEFLELGPPKGLRSLFGKRPDPFWPGKGSIDFLLLRFLNQGVLPDKETALRGFDLLAERVKEGGMIFYFGYTALYLNSMDFKGRGLIVRSTLSGWEDYHVAVKNDSGRYDYPLKPGEPWLFPFYFLIKPK